MKHNDPLKPAWISEKYAKIIDNLDIQAKYKELLKQVLACTIKIGNRIVEIGKKIIETIIWALKKHPDAVAKGVIGAILAFLAAHIPIIGPVLAPVIAAAALLSVASEVLIDKSVRKHIDGIFGALAKSV